MPMLERPGGAIWYEITDLTPPWIETPPTILFHHGVGINAKTSNGCLPALADLLIGTDLAPLLPSIAQPTLLLASGESPFVPLSVMREIHALIPDSEVQCFRGVRHALAFSHGAARSHALRSFLPRRGRSGG